MNLTPHLLESALLEVIDTKKATGQRFIEYASKYNGPLTLVFSGDLEVLPDDDKQAMLFVVDVLLTANEKTPDAKGFEDAGEMEDILEEVIEKWEMLEGTFEEKMELFYDASEEQEAIAFVEEVLEEGDISKEGKETIYLTGYAIIEALSRA